MHLHARDTDAVAGILLARDEAGDGHTNVPIAAIVGGTLGGVALAVLAVVGWKLWGRSIRRQAEADRKRRLEGTKVKEQRRPSLTTIPRESIEKMTQTGYLPPPSRTRSNSAGSNKKVAFMYKEGTRDHLANGQPGPSTASQRLGADSHMVSRPRPIRPGSGAQGSPRRKQRKSVPPVPPLPSHLVKASSSTNGQTIDQPNDSVTSNEKATNPVALEVVTEDRVTSGDTGNASGAPIARGLRRNGSLTGDQRVSVASKNSGSERSVTSSRRWSWRYLLNNAPFSFRQSGYERNRLSEATASTRSWRGRDESPQVPMGVAFGGDDELEYPQAYIDFAESQTPPQVGEQRSNGQI